MELPNSKLASMYAWGVTPWSHPQRELWHADFHEGFWEIDVHSWSFELFCQAAAVCSQKSRQSKEKVQEVACCVGKSLEDVETVKEGMSPPCWCQQLFPWTGRCLKGEAVELSCVCIARGGVKAQAVHVPNLSCFPQLWEVGLRLRRAKILP